MLLVLTFAFVQNVRAENLEAGNTNAPTNSENGNSDTAALAREKRLVIKSQTQELAELREELKTKVAEQKTLMLQYRDKEQLTEQDKLEIKEMLQTMENLQTKLGSIYQNAVKAMNSYKADTSTDKITGLDLVITSQQERIQLLQEAITALEE